MSLILEVLNQYFITHYFHHFMFIIHLTTNLANFVVFLNFILHQLIQYFTIPQHYFIIIPQHSITTILHFTNQYFITNRYFITKLLLYFITKPLYLITKLLYLITNHHLITKLLYFIVTQYFIKNQHSLMIFVLHLLFIQLIQMNSLLQVELNFPHLRLFIILLYFMLKLLVIIQLEFLLHHYLLLTNHYFMVFLHLLIQKFQLILELLLQIALDFLIQFPLVFLIKLIKLLYFICLIQIINSSQAFL